MINERIREVRKRSGLTLEKFGEKVGLKKSGLSAVEIGRIAVTDRLIMMTVKEFGVDEQWLRTGEGEMFPPKSEYDKLAELTTKMLRNKDDKERLFITDFLYNHMKDEDVHTLLDTLISFVDDLKATLDTKGEPEEHA
mgnify:CR=1 FL=1